MLVIDILLTKNIKNDNNSISNNMISSLVEDNDKNLWIGTDGGLNKMNLNEDKFIRYYEADGVATNEYNGFSYHENKDGNIYFGGINGLTLI